MHPISIATMGKFGGPPKKIMTEPIRTTEIEEHKFPSAQVTNIESQSAYIKIQLINDEEDESK